MDSGRAAILHALKALALKLFGLLLVASAIALALSRAPDRPVATLVARWAPPPSDFVELDDGQLVHLRDEGPRGDALPLVLVHGTSASLHTWEGWVRALRGDRRVVTFDLPGFGLTGPAVGGDYGGDADARFVLALLDRLQLDRVVIGGNSLGGEVAWRVATLAPQRVAALVLVDAAGPAFDSETIPVGWVVARIPVLDRLLEHLLPRGIVAASLAAAYADPARITPELVDRYFELTLREGNRRALVQRLRRFERGAGADRVATITQPTLILWGGRDRMIPPSVGRWFHETIAGSTLVVFDDLGHVPHEEDPARSVMPVVEFLAAHR